MPISVTFGLEVFRQRILGIGRLLWRVMADQPSLSMGISAIWLNFGDYFGKLSNL